MSQQSEQKMEKRAVLPIEGMHCASCAVRIEEALKDSNGIREAVVNFTGEKAYVDYDPGIVGLDDMRKTVEQLGYGVRPDLRRVQIGIGGMHCASCALKVEKALFSLPGVENAYVNLATGKATVDYHDGEVTPAMIAGSVESAGYELLDTDGESADAVTDTVLDSSRDAKRRMILAWGFTLPITVLMFMHMFFGIAWPNRVVLDLLTVVLALPVVFAAGFPTLKGAFRSILHWSANMDVLIALGTLVSLATGVVSLFYGTANFAGISAMIMAFHLTGRFVEAAAKGRASQATRRLLELGAKTARLLLDGEEKQVPAWALQPGDIMVVRPGEKIPTDGVVIEGDGAVDESMATGESMPVARSAGDELIGGTVNLDGRLEVRATKVGEQTFLSQVVRMVEECQGSKVPIQKIADRITSRFVPVVLGLAAVTLLLWLFFPSFLSPVTAWGATFLPWVNPQLDLVTRALFACVAVLVIACPCALGLATPTALMVGSGLGALNGILIKRGEAVQLLKEVRAVVFDKTGTVTVGKPAVTDVVPIEGVEKQWLVYLSATAESGSEHPVGRAIVAYAEENGVGVGEPKEFRTVRGKGVAALVEGSRVLVGSRGFMAESGIDTGGMESVIVGLEREAKTTMIVAHNGVPLGVVALQDVLKAGSYAAIEALESMGIETVMVTGDNSRTAEAIASKAGINRVLAGVLPEGKVEEIRKLQARYGVVAMVGDGINDAPALTQADVGIAIGTGTDIAIEASDVTLVRGDLGGVVSAVRLSKAIFRKIKQNLFWAFMYNLLAIPLAVLGLLHPVIAEACMATSSVSVVSNANLLRFSKIK
jgi:Cu+-exporting ATPase